MSVRFSLAVLLALAAGIAAPVTAQPASRSVEDRPFLFSLSTLPADSMRLSVHLDSLVGESAFNVMESDRPEQRLALHAALGHRLTFVGRVGVSDSRQDARSSQQGELLVSVLQSVASRGSLAVGGGVRHETAGANVLLGRIAAGRSFSGWRMDGSALFEKPFSTGRDAVDLITTFGLSRRVTSAVHAGIELFGEDLEGFWARDEAEGGARLMIGPSIRITPPARRWQVSLAGGPMIHATRSGRTSEASRGLPSSGGRSGYAARASLGYGF
jgi:hypothetical protein